ncbi:hypothetical protein OG921_24520 [Aldersonia sp. NBC_00410]|nr:hypothetical protein [Aldersonia sp. NBC_00410]
MAHRDSEHHAAGLQSRFQWMLDAAANSFRTERTRAFLETGLGRLAEREFCAVCPAALLCAAAEVELNQLAPSTRRDGSARKRSQATQTLAGLSITTVDRLDPEDICFGKVVRAITQGYLFEPTGRPNSADPLDPANQQLLWLADRVRTYTQDAAGRIASGQHAAD